MIDKNSTKEYLTQLLKTDVKEFNQYRKESNYKRIDLSGADLFGANLVNAELGGADLSRAELYLDKLSHVF